MSRVGNNPIPFAAGVKVTIDGNVVTIKGDKGEMQRELPMGIKAEVIDSLLVVTRVSDSKHHKTLHGTTRSHLANMIEGVSKGFVKELEINGVGYRAQMSGSKIVMALGFSHDIEYEIPEGVTVTVPSQTEVKIEGCDKHMVGHVAARLRDYSPAEPYKGKGVKYKGEQIRRKAGKTVA